jgi:hypothetical protein
MSKSIIFLLFCKNKFVNISYQVPNIFEIFCECFMGGRKICLLVGVCVISLTLGTGKLP